MDIQANLNVEGFIKSNKTIEGLNTTVFEDVGSENNIVIDIKGNINFKEEQDLIVNYEQLLNIPIKIRKKGNLGQHTAMTVKVGTLAEIQCKRKDVDGELTDLMVEDILKDRDIFTATFNGSFFIVEGDCFLSKSLGYYVDENISALDTKLENSINSLDNKIDDLPKPNTNYSAILLTSKWNDKTQTLAITGINPNSSIIVGVDSIADEDQWKSARKAKLRVSEVDLNEVTVVCDGDVPKVDMPISVLKVGD